MTELDQRNADIYKPPDYLPRPELPTASFPYLAILAGISVTVPLGVALFAVGMIFYIYILYNAVIGAAIGRVIGLGPKRSKYTNQGVLLGVTAVCSVLVYLIFNVAAYLVIFGGAEAGGISGPALRIGHFLGFLVLRAANEPFLFGIEPGIAGNFVVWAAEIAITFYVAWTQVNAAIHAHHAEVVPSEVVELIAHFLSDGQDVERVRSELAQRGWAQREHQDMAFSALESFALLEQAADEEKERRPPDQVTSPPGR